MTKEGLKNILLNVTHGDEKSFRLIFDSYSSKIYHFALKLTHSKTLSEEIVQEIFMKVWTNRKQLSEIESFSSYLYTITRNHAFNVLKRLAIEANANAKLVARLPLLHSETEERIICTDYENLLGRIVDNLPPQQKKVYSLCHQEGMKYEEAAARLNISRLTVKTHMQSALRTIKSQFGHMIQYCVICLGILF